MPDAADAVDGRVILRCLLLDTLRDGLGDGVAVPPTGRALALLRAHERMLVGRDAAAHLGLAVVRGDEAHLLNRLVGDEADAQRLAPTRRPGDLRADARLGSLQRRAGGEHGRRRRLRRRDVRRRRSLRGEAAGEPPGERGSAKAAAGSTAAGPTAAGAAGETLRFFAHRGDLRADAGDLLTAGARARRQLLRMSSSRLHRRRLLGGERVHRGRDDVSSGARVRRPSPGDLAADLGGRAVGDFAGVSAFFAGDFAGVAAFFAGRRLLRRGRLVRRGGVVLGGDERLDGARDERARRAGCGVGREDLAADLGDFAGVSSFFTGVGAFAGVAAFFAGVAAFFAGDLAGVAASSPGTWRPSHRRSSRRGATWARCPSRRRADGLERPEHGARLLRHQPVLEHGVPTRAEGKTTSRR